ncbi:MAG TPA: AAA family ATPase [Anaerolineales bacterium]|nr:AAA family ATPase [Anaerolineales bacterium]
MMKLLERESYLQQLGLTLQEAMAGHGRVVLVSGEAGIGKTSLIDHFTSAQADSVRILWGACDSLFTPRPLGPLHDIATQLKGELPALLHSEANQLSIFSACLVEMQRLPGILVFEDVHWADEATLDLIKFLGRRIQLTKSLLILSYRDDDLSASHPLRLVLGELPRSATLRLALSSLSQASVLELARATKQDEQADDLYATTGGNPFFVTEVLESEGTSVPATVRDAVLARAARLSPAARAVLDAACVVPGRVETWLLKSILLSLPAALEECVERGMLRTDGNSLSFRHELARRALEDSLSTSRRQALHREVLKALRERGEDKVQLSRLVHHAALAGEGEAVLRFAPEAARQAARVAAHLEAAAHYQTALHYADQLDLAEHARLLENRAYECYVTSQISEAVGARLEALEIWRQIRSPRQEGNNLRWLSRLHWFLGQRAPAERYAGEAITLLETLPPGAELAMAYSNRAQLHMLSNEAPEALHWGNQAIGLAEELDDPEILSHALNNVGTAEIVAGKAESGWAKLERSLQLAQTHELHEHAARAYTNLGSESVRIRDYDTAMHYLNDGIDYCIERDLDSWSLYQMGWRARANLEQGRWIEAGEDALAVLNNPRAAAIARIPALTTLGRLRVRRGDPDSQPVLDEARERALSTGELQRIGPVATARAEAAWWRGEMKQVIAEVHIAYQLALRDQDPWELGELSFWLWHADALDALPDKVAQPFALQMRGDWRAAAREWERLGCPYEQALALADGDPAAQWAALEIFQQLGARPAINFLQQKLGNPVSQQLEKEKFSGLTVREREVASLIARGKSNREIAEAMTVGVKTVETYVTRILHKLGCASRVQIATWAVEKGLGKSGGLPE